MATHPMAARSGGASRLPRPRRALAPGDLGLLAEAWLAVSVARLALAVSPLRRALRALEAAWRLIPARAGDSGAERVGWAVTAVAGRLHPSGTCLPRAAAAHVMLRRRGRRAALRVGFRRDGRLLLGHAWVEVDGRELPGLAAGEAWSALAPAGGAPGTSAAA
jgi:hypothetical protein